MTPDAVFSVASALVIPGWLLLVFVPGWRWTTTVVTSVLLPGLLGLAYIILFAGQLNGLEGGFGSLADVKLLFLNDWMVVIGWIHYLAFDLFVGSWEVRDAQGRGLSHLAVIPCLALTFMAGPAGLVLYFLVRGIWHRCWTVAC